MDRKIYSYDVLEHFQIAHDNIIKENDVDNSKYANELNSLRSSDAIYLW